MCVVDDSTVDPPPGSADAGGCNVKKVQHGLHEGDQLHVEGSVTRFGKISPLWQNFNSLWLFFEDLFLLGKVLNPIVQNLIK